jgi:hypothetical protein
MSSRAPLNKRAELTQWAQGYTAGRGYMCLAVAVCSGRGCLFLFAENFKNIRLKYYFNHLNLQCLSSYLIIHLQVRELFLLVLNLVQSVPLKCL